jgi:AraC-like DNA-binding protein
MLIAFAIQFSLSAINAVGYLGRSSSVLQSDAYPPFVNLLFGPLPIAMQVTFESVALYCAIRGWRADVDEARRLLRGLFLVVVGGLLFGTGVIELSFIDAASQTRAPFDNAVTLLRALGYAIVALSVLRFDSRVFERVVVRAAPQSVSDDAAVLDRDLDALTRALEAEKVYLTHGLSIGSLARHMGMPEYRLRRVIHKRLGYRNFNALLHEYRLKEACVHLANPARANVPILTIALEVGYQSIAPFNQAFRAAVGCTPSAYRQQHANPA